MFGEVEDPKDKLDVVEIGMDRIKKWSEIISVFLHFKLHV